jgi:hypothetical protein
LSRIRDELAVNKRVVERAPLARIEQHRKAAVARKNAESAIPSSVSGT